MRRLLLLILIFIAFSRTGFAQSSSWEALGPFNARSTGEIASGDGPWLYYLDKHSSVPYYEVLPSLYASSNEGRSWYRLLDKSLDALASNRIGEILLSNQGKLLLSSDRGISWTTLLDTASSSMRPISSPQGTWIGAIFLAGGAPFVRLYLTSDKGLTWSSRTFEADGSRGVYLYEDGSVIYSTTDSLYRMSAQGLRTGLSRAANRGFLIKGDSLLFGASIYRSVRSLRPPFDSLKSATQPPKLGQHAMDSNGVVYAISDKTSLYRTSDDGLSWERVPTSGSGEVSLQVSATGKVWLSGGERSVVGFDPATGAIVDGGEGIANQPIFSVQPTMDSAVAANTENYLYWRDQENTNWRVLRKIARGRDDWNDRTVAVSTGASPVIWTAIEVDFTKKGVCSSLDRGKTWDTIYRSVGSSSQSGILAAAKEDLFVATESSIIRFLHDGEPTLISEAYNGEDMESMPAGELLKYSDAIKRITTDHGATWQSFTADVSGYRRVVYSKGVLVYLGRDGLYRSTDLGATRTKVGENATGKLAVDVHGNFYGYFERSGDTGLYRSHDLGRSWQKVMPQAENGRAYILDLKVNERGRAYLGTARGVFSAQLPALPSAVSAPAPNSEIIALGGNRWKVVSHNGNGIANICTVDLLGRRTKHPSSSVIDLNDLQPGYYILVVEENEGAVRSTGIIVGTR